MNEKTQNIIAVIVLLMALAVPLTLGLVVHSVWVGLLVFASFCMLLWSSASMGQDQYSSFLFALVAGAALLGVATWMGHMVNRWLWVLPWLLFSLVGVSGGYAAYGKNRPALGAVAVLFSSQLGLFGITAPTLLYSLLTDDPAGVASFRWEWLLTCLGIACVAFGWLRGRDWTATYGSRDYVIFSLLGLLLLAGSAWRLGFPRDWGWLPVWVAAAIMMIHAARDVRVHAGGSAAFGIVLAVLCLGMAIAQPLWLERILGGQPQVALQPGAAPVASPTLAAAGILSESDKAATQLAQAAGTATAASAAETEKARPTPTKVISTQTPQKTLSESDKAATQLAQSAATATAASAAETAAAQAGSTPEREVTKPTRKEQMAAGWTALGSFLGTAVRSFWGWFYLLLFFLLGMLWIRRGGGLLFLWGIVSVVWWVGISHPDMLTPINRLITISPWKLLEELLVWSGERFGSSGWGILGFGLLLNLLFFAAQRLLTHSSSAVANFPAQRRLLGTTFANRNLQRSGFQPGRVLLATLFMLLSSPVLPILLWIALRQLVIAPGAPALQFLMVPNLALPHWKPIFQLPVLLPGLLATVVLYLQTLLQYRLFYNPNLTIYQKPVTTLVTGLILTFFVPAGVQLYILALGFVRLVTLPLLKVGTPRVPDRGYPPVEEEEGYEPVEEQAYEPPIIEEEKPDYEPAEEEEVGEEPPDEEELPVKPQPEGTRYFETVEAETLLELTSPAAGAALRSSQELWVIDQQAELHAVLSGRHHTARTAIQRPIGLALLPEGALVIGAEGKLVHCKEENALVMVSEIAAAAPVDGFALNPYGSMLAYVSFARSEVRGIFLAAQREQLFASLPGLSAAMAFSPDARFLALGAQDGAVHVLDLSTRQQAYTLKPSFFSGKVTSLHPMSAETWLVGYAEHLTLWNASGKQLANAIFNNPPCCVSVDSAQKRVAVGDARGNLRLYDGNLQEENDYHEVCSGAITRILFSKESDALLVACKDTVFKKLKR